MPLFPIAAAGVPREVMDVASILSVLLAFQNLATVKSSSCDFRDLKSCEEDTVSVTVCGWTRSA